MSLRSSKCLACPPLHLTKAVLEYAKRSTCRKFSCTSSVLQYRKSSQLPPSASPPKFLYLLENFLSFEGPFPKRSFVSTPIRYNDDENLFAFVGKDPNFVMPTYNPPVDRVVSPAVEEIFKDLLKLQHPNDIAVIGHLLMRRLCISNEQMMMILQARYMGGSGMSSSDASASAEAATPVVEEKKIFDLKLVGFDDKSKIKVIKEIRAITGLGLKEAKDLVDSVPKVLKKDVKKEEAEQIKDVLTKVGAVVEIV
jgi:large subunit ribosomal protein L7/L12